MVDAGGASSEEKIAGELAFVSGAEERAVAARLSGSATRKPGRGHEYGLHLTSRDKSALIAFLKTL